MNVSDVLDVAGKILLVPQYYRDRESEFSIAASIFFAVVGAVIGRNFIRPDARRLISSVLIFVLVALFSLYWFYLYDTGRVFYLLAACRSAFFLCLGMLGLSFGGAREQGEGGNKGEAD
jgi:hypothetical protein